MSATPPGSTPDETPYIRARAGGQVDVHKVGRVVLAFCVLVLAGVTVATAVGAAHQNSAQTKLQRRGVPVEVTVTSCFSFGDGIGQAVNYYGCHGTYTLDGHRYSAAIGGTRTYHPAGQKLSAFTVRGDPGLLSTATAVAKKFSPWTPFITPIILGIATVALAVGMFLWPRRGRSRRGAVPSATVA
jgi:hypothetical protein